MSLILFFQSVKFVMVTKRTKTKKYVNTSEHQKIVHIVHDTKPVATEVCTERFYALVYGPENKDIYYYENLDIALLALAKCKTARYSYKEAIIQEYQKFPNSQIFTIVREIDYKKESKMAVETWPKRPQYNIARSKTWKDRVIGR